ncbi:MAG: hypothetical protein ACP5C3_07290 [Methanomicrobiales archaeon]
MVYGGSSLGRRTEVMAVDNWITGRMTEYSFKKFIKNRFSVKLILDEKLHPGKITPQEVVGVKNEKSEIRKPNLFIGIKSSKMKNAYLIADEHGTEVRNADVYIFVRAGLPRDHIIRYLS